MIKRKIYTALLEWKQDKSRRPLIIRGARQIGKTYTITEFGKNEYESIVTLNFERNPEYNEIFSSFDPKEIIEKITLFTHKKVAIGKTLLFLDEIQECPRAIVALRYFYEEMQELNIIAAGSLLEFTMQSENFSIPVGRIQYLYMYPISFSEFLFAMKEDVLLNYLKDRKNLFELPNALHEKLIGYVRKYFFVGGMPAVVKKYLESQDIVACQKIQKSIIDTYIEDFSKYAKKSKHALLAKIFTKSTSLIGKKFVYSNIDDSIKSREIKVAFDLLEMAGVVRKIKRTSAAGIPLEISAKDDYFKVLFLDIGLVYAINNLYSESVAAKNITDIFRGIAAEQFVGQELLAYRSPYNKPGLYYWGRDARNSTAEVDYLFEKDNKVIPIEVKSGSTGRMRSLHMVIDQYGLNGVKISQDIFRDDKPISSIPFYLVESFVDLD